MDMKHRAARFSELLGMEVKGAITARGFAIGAVADAIHTERSTLSRYLNGRRDMPASILALIAGEVGMDPGAVVDRAYYRLIEELAPAGRPTGIEALNVEVGDPVRGAARPVRGSSQR